MSHLEIRLLGGFAIEHDGNGLAAVGSARLQSLLAYLLLHRQLPLTRRQLAFTLWPDSSETQAFSNLRKNLHRLRQVLPVADRFLYSSDQSIQWRPDAPYRLDVADFEQAVQNALGHDAVDSSPTMVTQLEEAIRTYQGDLLPTCYEDWLLSHRERLREQYLAALLQLIGWLEEEHEYPKAIGYARQLLREEPLREEAYQHLMRLHLLQGDRASALQLYDMCASRLRDELDVEPGAQLQALYRQARRSEVTAVAFSKRQMAISGQTRLPLIGRQQLWQQLLRAWQQAANGQAHLVLLRGEAGIGKTRLAEALLTWVQRQGCRTAYARSYAAEGALPYAPVSDWLCSPAIQTQWQSLDRVWLSELARLLPDLLSTYPDLPAPVPLAERWQRKRLFEALARALSPAFPGAQATRTSNMSTDRLLLVADDLQWFDHETLAWLPYLLRFEPRARLLILGTMRPEEVTNDHPLTNLLLDLRQLDLLTVIDVMPLSRMETAALGAQVANQTLDETAQAALFQTTEGNPLFVVESIRACENRDAPYGAAIQAGERDAAMQSTVPPKVQAIVQRRLAQLSATAQELAALAAVIGRSFAFAVLSHASGLTEVALVAGLDELLQRRVVRELTDDTYDFTHDRLREVAYAALSTVRRRHLHKRVAAAIEILFPDQWEQYCGQLALHHAKAQQWSLALHYYTQARKIAETVNALDQVIFYGEKTLPILDHLPNTQANAECRIETLIEMSSAVMAVKGYCIPERKTLLEQAAQWAVQIGDQRRLHRIKVHLSAFYVTRGDVAIAAEVASEHLAIAEHLEDEELLRHSFDQLAYPLGLQGKFIAARDSLAQALALEAFSATEAFARVNMRSYMADILWHCGYPEQAHRLACNGVQLADQLNNPFARVHSRDFLNFWAHRSGNRATARQVASEMLALCVEYGFPDYAISAQIIQGWLVATDAAATPNVAAAGLQQIEQALVRSAEINFGFFSPYYHYILAQTQLHCSQPVQALATVAKALKISTATGDIHWHAELLRFQGELYEYTGHTDKAVEQCYQDALTLARQQEIKMIELRATVSLARLWQRQERHADAHVMLTTIYGWFTEGFATTDLQAAATLLAELVDSRSDG